MQIPEGLVPGKNHITEEGYLKSLRSEGTAQRGKNLEPVPQVVPQEGTEHPERRAQKRGVKR